ncbi:MAG: orotidine-5'-phosphate decarboxylase [Chloroflexota bacterium]|nr:orotidine-5'-phosphate decarboxylase [Chloroflexota bacterium]
MFFVKLREAVQRNHSFLCVGLDPDPSLLPEKDVLAFNRAIIEATADLACAYKPNLAFYEALGPAGLEVLQRTVEAVPEGVPTIADAKRGDIGNTAAAYARALFDVYGFDAATVNPYLGGDALGPFLERADKGVFVLCRTSNPGGADLQDRLVVADGGSRPLYEVVAELAQEKWNARGNVGLVVGATYPQELGRVRQLCPRLTFLLPGVGAQGADVAAAVGNALDEQGGGFIISSSRQILYASSGRDYAQAARRAAQALRDEINRQREAILAARSGRGYQPEADPPLAEA